MRAARDTKASSDSGGTHLESRSYLDWSLCWTVVLKLATEVNPSLVPALISHAVSIATITATYTVPFTSVSAYNPAFRAQHASAIRSGQTPATPFGAIDTTLLAQNILPAASSASWPF